MEEGSETLVNSNLDQAGVKSEKRDDREASAIVADSRRGAASQLHPAARAPHDSTLPQYAPDEIVYTCEPEDFSHPHASESQMLKDDPFWPQMSRTSTYEFPKYFGLEHSGPSGLNLPPIGDGYISVDEE
jgi:hypothetical protein